MHHQQATQPIAACVNSNIFVVRKAKVIFTLSFFKSNLWHHHFFL